MESAPPPKSGPRPGSRLLVGAWLILLVALAAAAGYVFMPSLEQAAMELIAGNGEEQPAGTAEPVVADKAPGDMTPTPQDMTPEDMTPGDMTKTDTAPEMPEAGDQTAKTTPEAPPAATEPAAPPPLEPAPEPETATAAPPPPIPEPPAPVSPAAVSPPAESPPAESTETKTPTAPEPPSPAAPAPASSDPAPAKGTGQPEAATNSETQAGDEQTAALPPKDLPLWQRNSQPFDQTDKRPRIAIVLTGLGLSSVETETAIKQLPPAITLSFTPYSRKLNQWIALARVSGHEVMLDLPMEPTSYPDDDPGPLALLTALSSRQNLERLRWTLDRATGYVGVASVMGSRFTASAPHMEPILAELKQRGSLFLDNRASDHSVAGAIAAKSGVPWAINDRALDLAQASRVAIDARLVQLESIARSNGYAVAMGRPYPVTIERLRVWAEGLEGRGLALAPITALANRQTPPKIASSEPKTE